MALFKIRKLKDIEDKLPPDTILSKGGHTFYFNNENKIVFGELNQTFDKNSREYFSGLFFREIKNQLNLDGLNENDLKWMNYYFIITEIDFISNIDEEGNFLLEF